MERKRDAWGLGISTKLFKGDSISENLKKLRNARINSIELFFSQNQVEKDFDFFCNSAQLVKIAQEHDIRINSVHLPFDIEIVAPNEIGTIEGYKLYEKFFDLHKRLIIAAGKAGIPICVIHPCYEPIPDEHRQSLLEECKKNLRILADLAAEHNTKLAVENLPRSCLLNVSKEMQYVLEDNDNLYACFDTNHTLIEEASVYLKAIGSRVVAIHVSDYDFINERHWMPLKGTNDWKKIIETLEEIDYTGEFTYELNMSLVEDLIDCYKNFELLKNYK